jgi:Major Facilitator Superfamily
MVGIMITTASQTRQPLARPISRAWMRIAFVLFAVGWGANQFSPMLIVYRQELNLTAAAVAGLFAVYAATLVPGLLIGGPASDRYGRRLIVLPFVVLSPLATLLLIMGPRSVALLVASRALAGLCSGVVFGSATAWVQELSPVTGAGGPAGPRRAALALTAGLGLGPVVAAMLAQWIGDPLQIPYLPHLLLGAIAIAVIVRAPARVQGEHPNAPGAAGQRTCAPGAVASVTVRAARRWPPAAVRTWRFWLAVAPAAPLVFGSVSTAIVVLPEDVTSARTLSAGFAGLMTALAFSAGFAVQPLARRLAPASGAIAGLLCAAVGTGVGIAAVHGPDRLLAGVAAVLLGVAYGLCLVSGLRQAEQLAGPADRGAVIACYYALAYIGFASPYLAAGLGALAGQTGAFVILTAAAAALAAWTAGYTFLTSRRSATPAPTPRRSSLAGDPGTAPAREAELADYEPALPGMQAAAAPKPQGSPNTRRP